MVCIFANKVCLLDSIQASFESNCLDRGSTNLDNNVSSEGKDVSILFLVKWLDRNKFAFRVVYFRKNIVAGCAKVPHGYFRSTCVRRMYIEGFSSGRTVGARGYSNHPFSSKRKGADTRREEGGSAVWTTGCASLLLAYSRSRSFVFVLFQRNYMNWFLIAIDMPENINRWTTTWTGKLTFQRFFYKRCASVDDVWIEVHVEGLQSEQKVEDTIRPISGGECSSMKRTWWNEMAEIELSQDWLRRGRESYGWFGLWNSTMKLDFSFSGL